MDTPGGEMRKPLKTYTISIDVEDWYVFPPNWIVLGKVRASSPSLACELARNKGWTRRKEYRDIKARVYRI